MTIGAIAIHKSNMTRIIINSDDRTCKLHCSFCGQTYEIEVNAWWRRDANGFYRMNPDPRGIIYTHLTDEHGPYIAICPGRSDALGADVATPWEAVDAETGEKIDGGSIFAESGPNFRGPFVVC